MERKIEMLKKFKGIIYQDENAEKKVIDDCIKYVIGLYPNIEPQEVINSIQNGKNDDINCDYALALLQAEGTMLFNIAAEKFGSELWKNQAWKKTNCIKRCPFGSMCKKYLVQIDAEMLCYGQLMSQKIREEDLINLSKRSNIKIYRSNNDIYIDLNSAYYDDQLLSSYFFDHNWFIWWFGDNGCKGKLNGYNVIPYL